MKSEIGFLSITTIAMINQFVDDFNAGLVNIMRAQNPDQALWLAVDIATRRPQTAVFLRDRWGPLGAGDEGLLKTFPSPDAYAMWMVGQYAPYGKKLIHVVSNEVTLPRYDQIVPGTDMIMSYTEWMIRAMRWFHDLGMIGAWLRFPAHHPYHRDYDPVHQFDQLDQVVVFDDGLVVNGLRHAFQLWPEQWLSPNAYYTDDNFAAIEKALLLWEYLGKPLMAIGEFAWHVATNDAHGGFRKAGRSEEWAAANLIDTVSRFLLEKGILAAYYNELIWFASDTFASGPDQRKALIAAKHEIQIVPHLPIGEIPVSDPTISFHVETTANVNLRQSAVSGAVLVTIPRTTQVPVYAPAKKEQVGNQSAWFETTYDGKRGFFRADFAKLVPSPIPEPGPDTDKIYTQADMDALKVKYEDMMRHIVDVAENAIITAKRSVQDAVIEALDKVQLIREDIHDANNE